MKGVYIMTSDPYEGNEYSILGVYKKRKMAMKKFQELRELYNYDNEIIKGENATWFESDFNTRITLKYHLLNDNDEEEDDEELS